MLALLFFFTFGSRALSASGLFGLLGLVVFLRVGVVIGAGFTILAVKTEHVEVFVETKVVLESLWDKKVVEILDNLLDFIDLITAIVLFLAVALSFNWHLSLLEGVEERLSINSLDDSSSLAGLLVLLLLLDLLLGRVLALEPLDGGSLDALDLVLGLILESHRKSLGLEEVVVGIEYHLQGKLHVLGLGVLLSFGLDVLEVLHNWLILLFHLVPNETVGLHGAQPEVGNALLALKIADVGRDLLFLFNLSLDGLRLHNSGNLLLKLLVRLIKSWD